MSNELDYVTTQAAIATAIGSATGTDRDIGQALADVLDAAATAYHARYTGDPAIDAAKGAWAAAAQSAFANADHAARYALSLVGTPPSALAWDAYDSSALLARFDAATAATTSANVLGLLAAHRAAFASAWGGDPSDAYMAPLTRTITPPAIFPRVLADAVAAVRAGDSPTLAALAAKWAIPIDRLRAAAEAEASGHPLRPYAIIVSPGVRELELATYAAMVAADGWVAMMGF